MTDDFDRNGKSEDSTDRGPPTPGARPAYGFAEHALGATTKVVEEHGRWVVYLNVEFWEPRRGTACSDDRDSAFDGNAESNIHRPTDLGTEDWPIQSYWRRIADYPDRQRADVAARWIERSADRNLHEPPHGL